MADLQRYVQLLYNPVSQIERRKNSKQHKLRHHCILKKIHNFEIISIILKQLLFLFIYISDINLKYSSFPFKQNAILLLALSHFVLQSFFFKNTCPISTICCLYHLNIFTTNTAGMCSTLAGLDLESGLSNENPKVKSTLQSPGPPKTKNASWEVQTCINIYYMFMNIDCCMGPLSY